MLSTLMLASVLTLAPEPVASKQAIAGLVACIASDTCAAPTWAADLDKDGRIPGRVLEITRGDMVFHYAASTDGKYFALLIDNGNDERIAVYDDDRDGRADRIGVPHAEPVSLEQLMVMRPEAADLYRNVQQHYRLSLLFACTLVSPAR